MKTFTGLSYFSILFSGSSSSSSYLVPSPRPVIYHSFLTFSKGPKIILKAQRKLLIIAPFTAILIEAKALYIMKGEWLMNMPKLTKKSKHHAEKVLRKKVDEMADKAVSKADLIV